MNQSSILNKTRHFGICWPTQDEDIDFIRAVIRQAASDHEGILPLYDADSFFTDDEQQRLNVQLPLWLQQIAMDLRHRHGNINFPFVMECALVIIIEEIKQNGVDQETLEGFQQIARVGLGLRIDDKRLH